MNELYPIIRRKRRPLIRTVAAPESVRLLTSAATSDVAPAVPPPAVPTAEALAKKESDDVAR
jgi:hypothetical protein